MIRTVSLEDAGAIVFIYNYYVKNSPATFEEIPLSARDMAARIRTVGENYPWIVWEENGEILGYAYMHRYHERAAYRYTAEDSIYIRAGCEGRGIGRALLENLINAARKMEIRVLLSIITVPNEASVGLHEKFGFKKAGQFHEVGYKFGQWLDVGYWELLLDAEEKRRVKEPLTPFV
ncbi:MAG: GNAT family N-acetyltransferase [Spirochaetaceae bacterium]|jgi:phosphinothricin acetyltransferase|nr:GNAT family N-acetyltransferase [Spirochaetaceae bacterium]